MPWKTMDAPFVKTYIEFMEILVSAKTEFLSRTCEHYPASDLSFRP